MLRKRLSRWTSKIDGGQQPFCAFPESFWQYYIESLGKDLGTGYSKTTAPNLSKYHAHSAAVLQVKAFFTPDQPQPSTSQIIASLKSPFLQGDVIKAFHLLRYFQLSDHGFFITNDGFDRLGSQIELQGAENWQHVMCYMDALLFSMFANLESFEPILFLLNQHPNSLVTQLLGLLRVYVNLMRLGNLITTDITQKICECLSNLGFTDALSHRQQDCAPLFEFLTETLAMPLLTFRVEIQHSGKLDNDDTKYSKERILFVSIPGEEHESEEPILLEECLEHYFNNSISVKRELQRRATLEEQKLSPKPSATESASIVDVDSRKNSEPLVELLSKALNLANGYSNSFVSPTQNRVQVRTRSSTLSIWSISSVESKPREVMLPAWMLLRLMPFYTDDNELNHANESIARNTHEFANRRPVLPICLKRYSFSSCDNSANRMGRKIVIPPVIDLPLFLADDANDSTINGSSFKLILESVVCHRGTRVQSGHFVSAVRKNAQVENETLEQSLEASWYLYDDMSLTKVVTKSFKEIFECEWPYLLFYRLVPSSTSLNRMRLVSTNSMSSSPLFAPKGHQPKYWTDDTLTPIISISEENRTHSQKPSDLTIGDKISNIRKPSISKSCDSSLDFPSASIPIPDVLPTDPNFVDIRKRYLWYVTDKDKNYYKESASLSKTGSRNMSISVTPQYRRNSQWSETSDISGLSLSGDLSVISKLKPDVAVCQPKIDENISIAVEEVDTKSNMELSADLDPDNLPARKEKEDKSKERNSQEKIQEFKGKEQKKRIKEHILKEKAKENRNHLHRIFTHDKDRPLSLARSHVKKRHAEYKKEKCTIT